MKTKNALNDLLAVMEKLRSPEGCPWDREQNHRSLRFHAVEEAYELVDAIDSGDDQELAEELGDLLLQVVFHCQLARERKAFNFNEVARRIVDKLIRRHPHVFGEVKVRNVDQVWANWERIKTAEKAGTKHHRASVLDGIPKHLPALMRAEKLIKKARRANLLIPPQATKQRPSKKQLGGELFRLATLAQQRGWSAEELLREEVRRTDRLLRQRERAAGQTSKLR